MKLLELFKELSLYPKNVTEVRSLILQMAIKGKLTAKWREEHTELEPVSVLLKKIEEEKNKLIRIKKIREDKDLESIDTNPFLIPNTWVWVRLYNISSITGGFAFESSKYVDEGIRVIRISDFDEKGFKEDKIVRYRYTDDLEQYRLEERNILIAMTGGTVGKSFFVEKMHEKMVVNQRVATIKVIKPMFEAFVNCVIQTPLIQNVVNEAKNSTNDNISMADIKGFKIPLPPLEEQQAIVETVNQLFTEIVQLESLTKERIRLKEDFTTSALNKLETSENTGEEWKYLQQHFKTFFTETGSVKKLRETILQLAVQGKLTANWRKAHPDIEPASELLKRIQTEKQKLIKEGKIKKENPLPPIMEDEVPFELPEGWIWCRLHQLTEVITKGSSPNWQGIQYVDENNGGILFITSENVGTYKLLLDKKKYVEARFNSIEPRSILKSNDILMNIVGGSIGRTAIYDLNEVANINQAVTIIRLLNNNDHNYFLYFFNSPTCISYMYNKQVDNARPNLSMGNIAKFTIPLPPYMEQQVIVEKVSDLLALCNQLEQQIESGKTQVEQLMKSCLRDIIRY